MNDSMSRLYQQYTHSFTELHALKEPVSAADEKVFRKQLNKLFRAHSDVLEVLANGVRVAVKAMTTPNGQRNEQLDARGVEGEVDHRGQITMEEGPVRQPTFYV